MIEGRACCDVRSSQLTGSFFKRRALCLSSLLKLPVPALMDGLMKHSCRAASRPPTSYLAYDRFAGKAICSLAFNKQGASQLLAGGVLQILADLPVLQTSHDSVDGVDTVETLPRSRGFLVGTGLPFGCRSDGYLNLYRTV